VRAGVPRGEQAGLLLAVALDAGALAYRGRPRFVAAEREKEEQHAEAAAHIRIVASVRMVPNAGTRRETKKPRERLPFRNGCVARARR